MRRISIALLLFIPVLTVCQDHFVYDGSNWYFSRPDANGNPLFGFIHYEYQKDTMINGENCKFIFSSSGDHVIFLEMEDKVFYYSRDRFNLLYNFAVKVNETIFLDMWVSTFLLSPTDEFIIIDTILPVRSIVTDIDSIYVEDLYLKKITVDIFPESEILEYAIWPSSIEYIEYLGYLTYGIIPLVIEGEGPLIDMYRRLRCYSDSRFFYMTSYWQQFEVGCDYRITEINETRNDEIISVSPNPAKEVLKLQGEINNINRLLIVNINGEVLLCEEREFSHPIQINFLPTGVYLLSVEFTSGAISTYKFLKF